MRQNSTRFDNDTPDSQRTRRTVLKTVGGLAALAATGTGTAAAGAGEDGEFTKTDHEIDSFDGTELAATLYEPAGNERQPAMLLTHGYGSSRSGVDQWAAMYASNGYVTLTYDSRGFGESGGTVTVDGPKEVKDAQTLITWLADDDNANVEKDGPDNPKIGMDGLSYGGGIQLNTAAAEGRGDGVPESDDRIDAIVPRITWNDLTYSLGPNGVIKRNWALLLTVGGAVGSHSSGDDARDYIQGQSPELYEILIEGLTRNELTEEANAYFDARSPSQDIEDITAPTLFVQGWPDTLFVPNEAIWSAEGLDGTDHRFVFSNTGHSLEVLSGDAQLHSELGDRKALDWIDTHLRGDGESDLPPVTYYERQTDEWSTADAIPPTDAEPATLSLADVVADERDEDENDGDETFVFNSVIPTSTSQLFPKNADTSVTSVDFDFPVEEEIEVLGAPQLSLNVELLGPETRLFAKFSHVRDGESTLINNQVTPLKVEGEPGSIETAEVEMVAFQRRLEPGDTLRFTVATTDAGFQSSRVSSGARIHHSDEHPTTVEVPVVGADGFADSTGDDSGEGEFLFGDAG